MLLGAICITYRGGADGNGPGDDPCRTKTSADESSMSAHSLHPHRTLRGDCRPERLQRIARVDVASRTDVGCNLQRKSRRGRCLGSQAKIRSLQRKAMATEEEQQNTTNHSPSLHSGCSVVGRHCCRSASAPTRRCPQPHPHPHPHPHPDTDPDPDPHPHPQPKPQPPQYL